MNRRLGLFLVITFVAITAATSYAVSAAHRYQERHAAPPTVPTTTDPSGVQPLGDGPRIFFRHTGVDREYGLVASVPLRQPDGARTFTDIACDRVDATATAAACLHTERGVATKFVLEEFDSAWHRTARVSVPGIPSRTRLSEDGSLVATTTFVSGHSYMQVGFSTVAEIRDMGGRSYGNLENWTLVVQGKSVAPVDRNIWGVTFVDDRSFYATAATGGETHLVRGDLRSRTLTSVADHVECPSISPDGTRIAFKQATERGGRPFWTPAVLDLASGERTVLQSEKRNVDDQIEWLDDDTILYGLARPDQPGVTDVWSLDTRTTASPRLLIQQAWSPAVVR